MAGTILCDSDYSDVIYIQDTAGEAVDISGWTFEFKIYQNDREHNLSSGVSIANASAGTVAIELTAAQTKSIGPGMARVILWRTDNGRRKIIGEGSAPFEGAFNAGGGRSTGSAIEWQTPAPGIKLRVAGTLPGPRGEQGEAGADGAKIFVQNNAPSTSNPDGSIWIDANSADQDLYQLSGDSWVDTGVNVKGDQGEQGEQGIQGIQGIQGVQGNPGDDGSLAFVQNSAPSTSNPEGSLWIDADSSDNDLYQLQSGSWVDTGVNLKGADGLGTGDVTAASNFGNDNRLIRSDGTTKGVQASGITVDDSDNLVSPGQVKGATLAFDDSDASHKLIITTASNLTADRTVQLNPGDGNRTITVTGNSSLNQDVRNSATPTFAGVNVGNADTTLARVAAGVLAVEGNVLASYKHTAWTAAGFSSPNVTMDVADGAVVCWSRTMAGAETLALPTNMPDGSTIYAWIAAGSNTLSFAGSYEGAGGELPDCEGDCLLTIVRHGSRYYVSALIDLGN